MNLRTANNHRRRHGRGKRARMRAFIADGLHIRPRHVRPITVTIMIETMKQMTAVIHDTLMYGQGNMIIDLGEDAG